VLLLNPGRRRDARRGSRAARGPPRGGPHRSARAEALTALLCAVARGEVQRDVDVRAQHALCPPAHAVGERAPPARGRSPPPSSASVTYPSPPDRERAAADQGVPREARGQHRGCGGGHGHARALHPLQQGRRGAHRLQRAGGHRDARRGGLLRRRGRRPELLERMRSPEHGGPGRLALTGRRSSPSPGSASR
jgi:hypothetical protein